MRKVIVTEFMTLDGVIEDPGGVEKSPHGAWSFQFRSGDGRKYKLDEIFASGALLLGRVTYQGFVAAWPGMIGQSEFADPMNGLPKYVVSTTLNEATWNNSTLIKDNVAGEVSRLKQQDGKDILVYGSGQLVRFLMQHGLVDEYRLMVHPIVLGGGKRLFEKGADRALLQLIEAKTFPSGVVLLSYRTVGEEDKK